ncbi:VWA domain-containing protein [bacterium]|nr:VWA domain-containing protein [bacterium]
MTYQHPQLLWLLVALVPLAIVWRWVRAMRQQKLSRFVDNQNSNWSVLNPFVSTTARRWQALLLFTALALSVFAAARPLFGTRERMIRQSGIDILVALDVSESMLATDVKPNRLTEAKTKLRQVLSSFPGQRLGVIPFAGDAFLQCPLTTDYGIVLDVLQNVDTRTIGTPGTNLGRAIEVARNAFREGSVGTPVLVLITDGEDHSGHVEEQAKLAAEEGILIYTLGIGSTEGSPIVMPDGTLKEDADGSKILSKLDAETLVKVAEMTGGKAYIADGSTSLDVKPLISELRTFQQTDFAENRRVVREERFQYPLALALILLFLEGLIGDRRERKISRGMLRRKEAA